MSKQSEKAPSSQSPLKRYGLLAICVLCGTSTAMIVWQKMHREPSASDIQAQSMGLKNSDEYKDTHIRLDSAIKKHRLSDNDFQQIENYLRDGSAGAKRFSIIAIWKLQGHEQHQKAMDLLAKVGVDQDTVDGWARLSARWTEPGDSTLIRSTLTQNFKGHDDLRRRVQLYGFK